MRLLLFAFYLLVLPLLRADLLSDALQTFPANTQSLEYDHLAVLRQLPNYNDLRKQYTSDALKRVKSTLLQLNISEDQLSEVVTASGPSVFFGLIVGNFNTATSERDAAAHQLTRTALGEGSAFCSQDGVCVLFPNGNNGRAAFGTLDQLRAMNEVREGHAPNVKSKSDFAALLPKMNLTAPIVGLAPGSEIGQLTKNVMPSSIDLSSWYSAIESFGYSIRTDTQAHLDVQLLCASASKGKLVSDALNAAGVVQRATAALSMGNAIPISNLKASSSGPMVAFRFDAKLGS
jgi:hypothetical protein